VTQTGELRTLTDAELKQKLGEAYQELFNLRFRKATKQLDNTARIQVVRRDIARMTGRVVSDKMDKTVVVVVETLKRHRLYGKVVRNVKRYQAHDESNASHTGDLVRIEETRPLSKEKRWIVTEILERAQ
jgi:small subunit ribosomal protein S17